MELGWLTIVLWVAAAAVSAMVGIALLRRARVLENEAAAPTIRVVPAARLSVGEVAPEPVVEPVVRDETPPEPVVVVEEPVPEPEHTDEPVHAAVPEPEPEPVPEIVPEPEPVLEPEAMLQPEVPPEPVRLALIWPSLVDPDTGPLDEATRATMIEGLTLIGDSWAAAILVRAASEEPGELAALAAEAVPSALDRAYGHPDARLAGRLVAITLAARTGHAQLLVRALADPDLTLALSAARGLARAGRLDLVAGALVDFNETRAAEIRRAVAFPDEEA